MSLNWDYKRVKDSATVMFRVAEKTNRAAGERKGESYLRGTSHAIIMATMVTGIPEITEATLLEFWARLNFAQALHGEYVTDHEGKNLLTYEVVKAHIGLSTNASRRTRAEFLKTLGTNFLDDRIRHQRRVAERALESKEDADALVGT